MDMWKFFDITHREQILCNPMSLEKLEQLITLLPLKPGARVLDIATGKRRVSHQACRVVPTNDRDRS
jgi:hypothetical protein